MNDIVILIPPSEGKNPGGTQKPLGKLPKITQELLKEISAYSTNEEKLYGVKGNALESAKKANATLSSSKTLLAIERYSGVVYQGLDYSSLSAKEKSYANKHIQIVSGLFGLVTLDALLPDYKLSITKLGADKKWKEENTKKLKGKFVIDLLPKAHQKAVHYDQGIIVDFIVEKNGKKTPAGHQGKLIKGRFLRWLVQTQTTNPANFKNFKEDGFSWNGSCFLKRQ